MVFTGGTISVSPSRDEGNPALGANELLGSIGTPGLQGNLAAPSVDGPKVASGTVGTSNAGVLGANGADRGVPVQAVDLYRVMSESLTWDHLGKLVNFLRAAMQDPQVRGLVVSHGTDTMEEVSYLVDLVGPWPKPIVFTGAMRHSELTSADGPANLLDAIQVAYEPESAQRGVLVVMNQEIHAARYVLKEHSTNLATFHSPGFGALGSVVEGRVRYYWDVRPHKTFYALSQRPGGPQWPQVEVIRLALSPSTLFFQACLDPAVDGIIVEGFGAGHVPDYLLPDLQKLLDAQKQVWVVPRTHQGPPLYATYGTPGSEIGLQAMGVKMEEGPGYKARLRMILEIAQAKRDGA